MNWNHEHMDSGWGVVMMVSMLLFWLLVVVAIVWLVRTTRTSRLSWTPSPGGPGTANAEQLLAERLARGEIEPEDYQARLAALTSRP